MSKNGEYVTNSDNTMYNKISNINPFLYRGYYYDRETGLYYLNTRYYDPETGRFINADDISNLDTENINGLNLYAYCFNNPVNDIDTNGTWSWKNFWKGVVATVSIVGAIVISVATAGTAAPVIVGTLMGGLVVGGINATAQAIFNGGIEGVNLLSLGINTFFGGVSGAFAGGTIGIVGQVGINMALGGVNYSINQKVTGGKIKISGLIGSSILSGISALIGGPGAMKNGSALASRAFWKEFYSKSPFMAKEFGIALLKNAGQSAVLGSIWSLISELISNKI